MKIKKIIFDFLFLVIMGVGIYGYKLHALALEGNKIFEYRCTNVNPHLIIYKKSFINFADYLKHPDKYTKEEIRGVWNGYLAGMRLYVKEENIWLVKQNEFVNRWDYRLFEPWYIKLLGKYQWKMYEAYKEDARYLLGIWDNNTFSKSINDKMDEIKYNRDKYEKLYFDFFDETQAIIDWRKFFGRVPIPEKCNADNMIIPDTSGILDWERNPDALPVIENVDPEEVS